MGVSRSIISMCMPELESESFESGFIGADIIQKYPPEKYSLYICGPRGMHDFLNKDVLPKLCLEIFPE